MNLNLPIVSLIKQRAPVVIAALLTLLIVFSAIAQDVFADTEEKRSEQHVLTVHDGDIKKGIYTDKDTLREALNEAGMIIEPNDVTEPSLDEELVSGSYDVNIYRARTVTVVDGNNRSKVMSPYRTAKQIAKQAKITLQDEDLVSLEKPTDVLRDGAMERLVIDRATEFTLIFYGKKTTSYTQATTVGEMLESKDIMLGDKDKMSVKNNISIKTGMKIEIWREGKQTITEEESVAFQVRQIQDANREVGYKKVKTPGTKGKRMATYEVVIKNGKEVSRKEVKSVILQKSSEQIEVVGTQRPPVVGPAEILAKINAASDAKGIDGNRVAAIAKCESGFNQYADSGYYKGIFQHDPNYWAARATKYGYDGASIYDIEAQIGVSTSMMAGGGWSHWGCKG